MRITNSAVTDSSSLQAARPLLLRLSAILRENAQDLQAINASLEAARPENSGSIDEYTPQTQMTSCRTGLN